MGAKQPCPDLAGSRTTAFGRAERESGHCSAGPLSTFRGRSLLPCAISQRGRLPNAATCIVRTQSRRYRRQDQHACWGSASETTTSRAGNNIPVRRGDRCPSRTAPRCIVLTLQASGVAAYALAKAVLDRLVAKGFLTAAAAAEIMVSAAREVRRCGNGRAFIEAADQLEAAADTYAAKDLGPSVAIRTVRLRRR